MTASKEGQFMDDKPYDFDAEVAKFIEEDDLQKRRDIIYARLSEFALKRAAWYRDEKRVNIKKLLGKDVVMFAARGVTTAEEFVNESFRAYESSSEEGVMGTMWQAIITAIASDTLDTGDMMTVRDGALYVCELKSQSNTTNSASFSQELRELKDKCEAQSRFKRASGQKVLPAFCVLRSTKSVDEVRTHSADARDQPNRDIDGFEYRYLEGKAFWLWLTGFEGVEGIIDDLELINTGDVVEARHECIERLQAEMRQALADNGLGDSINDVLALKKVL